MSPGQLCPVPPRQGSRGRVMQSPKLALGGLPVTAYPLARCSPPTLPYSCGRPDSHLVCSLPYPPPHPGPGSGKASEAPRWQNFRRCPLSRSCEFRVRPESAPPSVLRAPPWLSTEFQGNLSFLPSHPQMPKLPLERIYRWLLAHVSKIKFSLQRFGLFVRLFLFWPENTLFFFLN